MPLQTTAFRALGIRRLASPLVLAQKQVTASENRLKDTYKAVEKFTENALQCLIDMDQDLAAIRFPDYPTPFITPSPRGPYSPLPFTLIATLSNWVDNALYSLSFSLTRYAVENVRTKHGKAKQGFFGLHKRPRHNILYPLYFSWRLYLRGKHGVWFGTDRALYRFAKSEGPGKKTVTVKLT
ncbi:hypothetical protein HF283_07135, partial [Acidithiobacillus ferrooxidans]|nr:hypothetical protein [Acidithiobacillus ferrooxidans]